jgi:hypothetical protein
MPLIIEEEDISYPIFKRKKIVIKEEPPKPIIKKIKEKCIVEDCKQKDCGHYGLCKKHSGTCKTEKEDCAVCMDGELKCPLSCGHWIHVECVIKSGKKECPMCKSQLKFTKEQEKAYKLHKKELRIKQEMEDFAEVVRNEVREIQERNERRRQQGRNVYQYSSTHIMSHDLIHFVRVITDNQNIALDRMNVVEMLLDMFPN